MAKIKKSKKNTIILISVILAIAIVATSVVVYAKSNSGVEAKLYTIAAGDIYETINSTGDVSSGASREYKVGTVATVKEVFVSVGDKVKEGDVLATFDTSNLDSQIAKLNSSYSSANKSYNSAVKSQKAAKKKLAAVNKEIKSVQNAINKIQKNSATTKKSTTRNATTVYVPYPTTSTTTATTTTKQATGYFTVKASVSSGQETRGTVAVGNNTGGAASSGTFEQNSRVTLSATALSGYSFDGWYDTQDTKVQSSATMSFNVSKDIEYIAKFKTGSSSVESLTEALAQIADSINGMATDVDTMIDILQVVSETISNQLSNGQTSADVIAQAVSDAIIYAIQTGIINEDSLNVVGEVLAESIASAVMNIDWAKIAQEFTNTKNVSLTTKELQLAALNVQAQLYALEASDTTVSAKKTARDTTKEALDILKESSKELEAGWVASFDGTVTECDLLPGEQSSLLSTGLKLENMNSMVVDISLSEYDNYKVKVGMPCKITTVYGSYEGEVISKAPTATGSSSASLLDNVGSMAGISGLSSLTSSGAGIACKIRVDAPDDNIIIGFDADVEIQTGEFLGITVVPIESISLEKDGTFVYLYNEEEKTATKTKITTGAISNSAYQVTSGLKIGDKIIAAPSSDYEDDTFKVKVVTK